MKNFFPTLFIFLAIACSPAYPADPNVLPTAAPAGSAMGSPPPAQPAVPHADRWGIYRLDIDTQQIELLYSSPTQIAGLRLNSAGDRLVFSQKVGAEITANEEIFTLSAGGSDLRRVTNNSFWDLYPAWSPDGSSIAFLSQRAASLGIYVMQADGSDAQPLYDSSAHEADLDWQAEQIAFTQDSSIWIMQSAGTGMRQITHPPRAGEWGQANLPFGDYDPRISPDGTRVVFERLLDDASPHGNYDFFSVATDGANEVRLTQSGYAQGLASWSHSGQQLVYIVAAVGGAGQYDLYLMNADGTESRSITPAYFPPEFLCHWAVFSNDDTAVYLIGEWWSQE